MYGVFRQEGGGGGGRRVRDLGVKWLSLFVAGEGAL